MRVRQIKELLLAAGKALAEHSARADRVKRLANLIAGTGSIFRVAGIEKCSEPPHPPRRKIQSSRDTGNKNPADPSYVDQLRPRRKIDGRKNGTDHHRRAEVRLCKDQTCNKADDKDHRQ